MASSTHRPEDEEGGPVNRVSNFNLVRFLWLFEKCQILDHYEKNILLNENFHFHAVNEKKFRLLDKVSEKRNKVKDIK